MTDWSRIFLEFQKFDYVRSTQESLNYSLIIVAYVCLKILTNSRGLP